MVTLPLDGLLDISVRAAFKSYLYQFISASAGAISMRAMRGS